MGIPRDGTGINCYGMGMGQMNMSYGQPWGLLWRTPCDDNNWSVSKSTHYVAQFGSFQRKLHHSALATED